MMLIPHSLFTSSKLLSETKFFSQRCSGSAGFAALKTRQLQDGTSATHHCGFPGTYTFSAAACFNGSSHHLSISPWTMFFFWGTLRRSARVVDRARRYYIYSDAQRGCWALRLLAPDLDTRVDKRHLSSHSLCAQFFNEIKFSSSSSIKFAERHRLRKSPTYPA